MNITQGGQANKSGKILETTVGGTLAGHGYKNLGDKIKKKQRLESLLACTDCSKRYATQVHIGKGIYSTDIFVDFYIIGSVTHPLGLIIECKWQSGSGSVDEKLPYLNANIENCYPAPTIVLIDGGGMKEGAVNWLKTQVDHNHNLLGVFELTSFINWARNNL